MSIDRDFVIRQRSRGFPDSAIATMGGWCVSDVTSVPRGVFAKTNEERAALPPPPLVASAIPDVSEILCHVAEQYDVTVEDILGPSQFDEIVQPRHEAIAVVYELNRYTLKQLGQIFRKTDSAILYGLRAHYERLRTRGPARDW